MADGLYQHSTIRNSAETEIKRNVLNKAEFEVKPVGSDKIALRRYEDDLYVSGLGITVMGVWTVLKTIMQLFIEYDKGLYPDMEDQVARGVFIAALFILVAILMTVILAVHLYIGMNAVRAAQGRPYRKGYYKATIIMLVITILGMAGYVPMLKNPDSIGVTVASILVDLTTIYIFIIVIISAKRIMKLREELIPG